MEDDRYYYRYDTKGNVYKHLKSDPIGKENWIPSGPPMRVGKTSRYLEGEGPMVFDEFTGKWVPDPDLFGGSISISGGSVGNGYIYKRNGRRYAMRMGKEVLVPVVEIEEPVEESPLEKAKEGEISDSVAEEILKENKTVMLMNKAKKATITMRVMGDVVTIKMRQKSPLGNWQESMDEILRKNAASRLARYLNDGYVVRFVTPIKSSINYNICDICEDFTKLKCAHCDTPFCSTECQRKAH